MRNYRIRQYVVLFLTYVTDSMKVNFRRQKTRFFFSQI